MGAAARAASAQGQGQGSCAAVAQAPPPPPQHLHPHLHPRPPLPSPALPSPHCLPHLPPCRWYLPQEEWKCHVHTDAEDSAPSVFDALQAPPGAAAAADGAAGGGAVGGGGGGAKGGASPFVPVLRLPSGCSEARCAVCAEKFALRWDDAAEEWLLLDAVAGVGGQITHSGCVA